MLGGYVVEYIVMWEGKEQFCTVKSEDVKVFLFMTEIGLSLNIY